MAYRFAIADTAARQPFTQLYRTVLFSLITCRACGLGPQAWNWPSAEKHELIVLKQNASPLPEVSIKYATQVVETGTIFYST